MTKPIVILTLAAVLTASSAFAHPSGVGVPDAASTGLLLGIALTGVGLGKRFFRR